MTLPDSLSAAGSTLGRPDVDLDELARRWAEDHPGGGTRREAMLRELEGLRAGKGGPGPHALDLRGLGLVEADLSDLDLTGSDLSHADLSRADLTGASLLGARLRGACLFEAKLTRAELSGADLTDANLQNVSAERVGLGRARLDGASLVQANLREGTLADASLRGADLKLARLDDCRARGADLTGADLSQSSLRGCDLCGARVRRATLNGADLRGASVAGIAEYEHALWLQADVREVDFNHAHLCRRFVLDQNYIAEFRDRSTVSRAVYYLWWLTSDCGRSLVRWGLLTAVIALAFAGAYTQVDVDYGAHETALSPLYYSVVTLTTLGYGDVLPASQAAQAVCMLEVFLGYVMLGGLLSIFSNKMARRAE